MLLASTSKAGVPIVYYWGACLVMSFHWVRALFVRLV